MPLMVNSGTKPAMMMAAEKKMLLFTSVAALAITANLPRNSGDWPRSLHHGGAAEPLAPAVATDGGRCSRP